METKMSTVGSNSCATIIFSLKVVANSLTCTHLVYSSELKSFYQHNKQKQINKTYPYIHCEYVRAYMCVKLQFFSITAATD